MVFGVIILVYFLRNVDYGSSPTLLFSGVLLLTISNILAFLSVDHNKLPFLFVLFVTTLFLVTMYDVRFGVLQGSDITSEYISAKITLNDNAWLLSRADQGEFYFTSASVSLFPSIVSQVTGLDLMPIFQLILRLVLALLPLVIFQTVLEIFGDIRLSALSALLFAQFYFNFNLLNFLIRQGMAEIFLVLTIFSLIRLQRAQSKHLAYALLLTLSMFGLIVSHYTLNYWSMIIILCIFAFCYLIGNLPKRVLSLSRFSNLRLEKPIINSVFLVFFVVVSIAWIYFTNLTGFLYEVRNELYLLAPSTTVTSSGPQSSWFFNNPAGPVVGFWFDLTAILILIGFLYMLFRIPKRSRQMPWIGGGLVMLATLAFWTVAGSRMLGVYIDRILTMGAPFFITFVAISILVVNKKLRGFVIIFLAINLPLNMVIPSYGRYILYRPEETVESVAPAVAYGQRIIRMPEFSASVWLDQHARENITFKTGFIETWFYARYNTSIAYDDPPLNSTATYFLLNSYNLKYGIWYDFTENNFSVNDLLNSSSICYNNGDAIILARTG